MHELPSGAGRPGREIAPAMPPDALRRTVDALGDMTVGRPNPPEPQAAGRTDEPANPDVRPPNTRTPAARGGEPPTYPRPVATTPPADRDTAARQVPRPRPGDMVLGMATPPSDGPSSGDAHAEPAADDEPGKAAPIERLTMPDNTQIAVSRTHPNQAAADQLLERAAAGTFLDGWTEFTPAIIEAERQEDEVVEEEPEFQRHYYKDAAVPTLFARDIPIEETGGRPFFEIETAKAVSAAVAHPAVQEAVRDCGFADVAYEPPLATVVSDGGTRCVKVYSWRDGHVLNTLAPNDPGSYPLEKDFRATGMVTEVLITAIRAHGINPIDLTTRQLMVRYDTDGAHLTLIDAEYYEPDGRTLPDGADREVLIHNRIDELYAYRALIEATSLVDAAAQLRSLEQRGDTPPVPLLDATCVAEADYLLDRFESFADRWTRTSRKRNRYEGTEDRFEYTDTLSPNGAVHYDLQLTYPGEHNFVRPSFGSLSITYHTQDGSQTYHCSVTLAADPHATEQSASIIFAEQLAGTPQAQEPMVNSVFGLRAAHRMVEAAINRERPQR